MKKNIFALALLILAGQITKTVENEKTLLVKIAAFKVNDVNKLNCKNPLEETIFNFLELNTTDIIKVTPGNFEVLSWFVNIIDQTKLVMTQNFIIKNGYQNVIIKNECQNSISNSNKKIILKVSPKINIDNTADLLLFIDDKPVYNNDTPTLNLSELILGIPYLLIYKGFVITLSIEEFVDQ